MTYINAIFYFDNMFKCYNLRNFEDFEDLKILWFIVSQDSLNYFQYF